MNPQRRKEVRRLLEILADAQMEVEAILSDEEDALDGMPDSLRGSENFDNMERYASNLAEAETYISEAVEQLNEAIS